VCTLGIGPRARGVAETERLLLLLLLLPGLRRCVARGAGVHG
jgi:hypothetical protein